MRTSDRGSKWNSREGWMRVGGRGGRRGKLGSCYEWGKAVRVCGVRRCKREG